jgi:hypothetical protein
METSISSVSERRRNVRKKVTLITFSFFLLVLIGYLSFKFYQKRVFLQERFDIPAYTVWEQEAWRQSLLKDNPSLIQEALLSDIQYGINDKFTKSDAYFFTHRYFDNGGNIYEIYQYVEDHPELAFLKEAESIYPEIFELIRNRALPPVRSKAAMHAFLAYLEVLDVHGYSSLAVLGTLTNQYAKLAYFGSAIKDPENDRNAQQQVVDHEAEKAIFFGKKFGVGLTHLLENEGLTLDDMKNPARISSFGALKSITSRDLLVGLNQFAASLRYLRAAGKNVELVEAPLQGGDIFKFTMLYSKKYVPELRIFTSLLNASTLALVRPGSVAGMKSALQPILKLGVVESPEGVVKKILISRSFATQYFKGTTIENPDLDIYGKKNIVMLANLVPDFKGWLKSNGWNDGDFQP